MTIRQTILDIMDDSPNREILIARLIDLVECERDRHYDMGQRAGRIGSHLEKVLQKA